MSKEKKQIQNYMNCFNQVLQVGPDEKQVIQQSIELLMKPQIKALDLEIFLKENLDLQEKRMKILYSKFVQCDIVLIFLGLLALRPWIKYRVIDALQISLMDKTTRNILQEFYECQGDKLEQIMKQTIKALFGTYDQDVYEELYNSIFVKYPKQIKLLRQLLTPAVDIQYVDKSIMETYNDLIQDYQRFPQGSLEKDLQRQIIHCYIKQKMKMEDKLQIQQKDFQQSGLNALRQRFQHENKSGMDIQTIQKFENCFKILNGKDKQKEEQSSLYVNLCFIKEKIIPINVFEIERLVKKTQQAKKKIQMKHSLLLIGTSGSGKSTCILKFLGYTLRKTKLPSGLITLAPQQKFFKNDHRTFHSSPDPKSCTRYINAVLIPPNMFPEGTSQQQQSKLYIVDSPGFDDSGGAQIDAANGIGTINALYGSKSIRLVIILQRDSLFSQNMKGAMNICSTVSNLFSDLKPIFPGMTLLFNKFQSQQQKNQLPILIDKKLNQCLTIQQQGDEKLKSFLRKMKSQAQKPENFIDPINQDFKSVLKRLTQKPMIKQQTVKEIFQYSFADNTKSRIEKFVSISLAKIKDKFSQSKYEEANFYLSMLSRLKKVIPDNDLLQRKQKQAKHFIIEEIKKSIKFFGKLFKDIEAQYYSQRVYDDIKICQKNLYKILQIFTIYQEGDIQIKNIKKSVEDNLIIKLKQSNQKSSTNLIKALRKYILQISIQFKDRISNQIKILYQKNQIQYQQCLKIQKYDQLDKIMERLKYFSVIFSEYSSQKSTECDYQTVRLQFQNLITKMLANCQNFKSKTVSGSYQKQDIESINKNLQNLQKIEKIEVQAIKVNVKKQRESFLKQIQHRIRFYLNELLKFVDCQQLKTLAESRIDRNMTNKKKQIDSIRQIANLKQLTERQYDQTFKQIKRKLEQSYQKLSEMIRTLRRTNTRNVLEERIEDFVKYRQFIMRCFTILGNINDEASNVIEDLDTELSKYLQSQKNNLRSLRLNLNTNIEQNMNNVSLWCEKINIFKNMERIPNIQSHIKNIKQDFHSIIVGPYENFTQKSAQFNDQEYKKFIYNLDTIESICFYSLILNQIFIKTNYDEIQLQKPEQGLSKLLAGKVDAMKEDLFSFLTNFNPEEQINSRVKELIVLLNEIVYKKNICIFLITSKNHFNPADQLKRVQLKLKQIAQTLNPRIQNLNHKDENQIVTQVLQISKICNKYTEIEDVLSKDNPQFKLFSVLKNKIEAFWAPRQKDEKDTIKFILQNFNDSKLSKQSSFQKLQQIYERHILNNEMKEFIIKSLLNISKISNQKIQNLKMTVECQTQSITDSNRLKQSFQIFAQTLQIQKYLKQILNNDIKRVVTVNVESLKFLGLKFIHLFGLQFKQILAHINNLNLNKCQRAIEILGQIEMMIIKYLIRDQNLGEQFKIKSQEIIKTSKQELCKIICRDQTQTSLKRLLNEFYSMKSQHIKEFYMTYGPSFRVDEQFKQFYQYQISNHQSKQIIQKNLHAYFDNLFHQLKQKSISSELQFKKIKQTIDKSLQNTPSILACQYKKSYHKLLMEIQTNFSNIITQISTKINQDSKHFNEFFDMVEKSSINKNVALYQKLISKFQALCNQKQRTIYCIKERVQYIKNYYVINVKINEKIISNNIKMKEILNKCYDRSIDQLIVLLNHQINLLKTKIVDSKANITPNNLFIQELSFIIQFSATINDQLLINSKNHQELIKKIIFDCMTYLNQQYEDKWKKVQEEAIFGDISVMKTQDMKLFQKHIISLSECDDLVEIVKNQLKNHEIKFFFKEHLQTIDKIIMGHSIGERIVKYQNQITKMVNQIQHYEFYNDTIKNHTQKQYQEDLKKLDGKLQFLQQNKSFFDRYILTDNNRYIMDNLYQTITDHFNSLFNECKQDLQKIFNDFNYEYTSQHQKIFLKYCQELLSKKYKAIDKKLCGQKQRYICDFIKQSFQEMEVKFRNKVIFYKECKEKYDRCLKQLQNKKMSSKIQFKNSKKIEIKQNEIKSYEQKMKVQIQKQSDATKKDNKIKQMKQEVQTKHNDIDAEIQFQNSKIDQVYNKQVSQQKEILKNTIKDIGEVIVIYQKILIDINFQRSKYKEQFNFLLNQVKNCGKIFVNMLIEFLDTMEKDVNGVGKHILTSYEIFSNYKNKKRTQQTKANNIQYVIKNLKKIGESTRQFQQSQLEAIKDLYEEFLKKFKQIQDLYRKSPTYTTIQLIVRKCKDKGKDLKNNFYDKKQDKIGIDKVYLLSYIFGLWSILKSQVTDDEVQYSIEPHPAQITTLVLLLGFPTSNEEIRNRFAQVLTGQGKSLILGGLSCYLALVGYKIKCACYSVYLSSRDWKSFARLFSQLNIQNQISYSTFNVLCQNILNTGQKTFSQNISQFINRQLSLKQKFMEKFSTFKQFFFGRDRLIHQNDKQILIIDQLDVFFDENYFGNTYCPSIQLKDETVNNLLLFIWQLVKKGNIKIKDILNSDQFKKLIKKYQNMGQILTNQVHGMVAAALNYKHQYFIIDQKIVYKDNDTISPKISYGFRTVFANIYQHERGMVSTVNYLESLKITLIAAQFSYAKLPTYYKNIIGVTGTLTAMPQFKKQILKKDYNIEDQYAIPSAFGMESRRIQKYSIVPDEKFYTSIIQDIQNIKDGRPIIIFFRNSEALNEFFNSQEFAPFIKKAFSLTEEHDQNTRDARILKATDANKLTLMTDSFGRGTDFILHNKKLEEAGGLHVIQTFLSLQESDEIQIKGRTARQKNPGSYHNMINQKHLQELGLKKQNFQSDATPEEIHNILLNARQMKNNLMKKTTMQLLQSAQYKHGKIIKVFQNNNLSQSHILQYLFDLNRCPEMTSSTKSVKTILGIDATGSMSHALAKVCSIIDKSFVQVYDVLKSKSINQVVQIKILVYRNYNSAKQQLLQSSAFQNTSENLRVFLRKVTASGGAGNQAVEVFMQAVNNQDQLDQVIIIGDAPANQQSQVLHLRKRKQQSYWNPMFPKTTMRQQLDIFMKKQIPIHSFYLAADKFFKDLSSKTKGEASLFNINSNNAADDLTQFIVKNILKIIGKNKKEGTVEELIKAYMEKYGNRKIN